MNRGLSLFVRDNLEAFAVAIALALVVRHYSLEAFRIPSKSMMPTLIGSDRGGDRILVDKYRWLFREPHRWEPVVFQYPLNRSRNFIKRVIGLPGERLRISDGDIWTSRDGGETWEIARKTADAQESLFFPYYPSPIEERDFFRNRQGWDAEPGWTVDESEGLFRVDAAAGSVLRFRAQVVPYGSEGIWGDPTLAGDEARDDGGAGDLRVRFDLHVERAGTLAVVLTEHGLARRLVLGPDGSRAVLSVAEGDERSFPVAARLRDGMDLSVTFANVDDTLVVELSGDIDASSAFEFPSDMDPEEAGPLRHRVLLEAEGIKATLEDLRIDRDVQYTNDGEWPRESGASIPPDQFFMMGDNAASSKDSRLWKIAEVTLKDGTVIRWEEGSDAQDVPGQPNAGFNLNGPDQVIEVKADVDGLVRRFHTKDVATRDRQVPSPFVPREHLVGRAFAIFWPIHVWPIVREPTRVGLIR